MNEVDVLAELGLRSELTWSLMQWWVSISFSIVLASYFGAQRLTKTIISIFFALYVLYTMMILRSLELHQSYIQAAMETLRTLSESSQLSPISYNALLQQGGTGTNPDLLGPAFFICSFLFTIGSVIYCYKKVRKN